MVEIHYQVSVMVPKTKLSRREYYLVVKRWNSKNQTPCLVPGQYLDSTYIVPSQFLWFISWYLGSEKTKHLEKQSGTTYILTPYCLGTTCGTAQVAVPGINFRVHRY